MKLFLLLITLLIITTVSSQLVITPNPIPISTKIGIQTTHNITLTNNHPFTIQNFQFSNLTGFTFPNITLESNQTKTFNFKTIINELKSESIQSIVKFRYLVDIPENPQTHNVDMTQSGFHPNFITIHEGDTVKWRNLDDIFHDITGSFGELYLPLNGEVSKIFNTAGTENYQDLFLGRGGTIRVLSLSEEQEVNNPNYDKILRIELNVIADPTNLSVILTESDFQVGATESKEGLLTIKNLGEELAQKIHMKTEIGWIKFTKNDFNLNPGETSYVPFTIQPLVFSNDETNKSYDIVINTKALNTEEYNSSIKVFIPYSNVFSDMGSSEGFLIWFREVYCVQNPNLFLCNTNVTSKDGQVIIRDPEIPLNLTVSKFYELIKTIARIEQKQQRDTNADNQANAEFKTLLTKLELESNQSLALSKKADSREKTTSRILYTVFIFVMIIGSFLYAWKKYSKYRYARYKLGR